MVERVKLPYVAAAIAAMLACWLGFQLLPTVTADGKIPRFEIYVGAGIFSAAVAFFVATVAPLTLRRPLWLAMIAAGMLVLVMVGNIYDIPVATDLAKILFATAAGFAFAAVFERPWWLLPIVILVPLADIWSVYSSRGVTSKIVKRAAEQPEYLSWPTVSVPVIGSPYDITGRLGIVDWLFLALFIGMTWRWKLGWRRVLVLLPLSFVATNVLVIEALDFRATPALPMLCLAFLLAAGPALIADARAAYSSR